MPELGYCSHLLNFYLGLLVVSLTRSCIISASLKSCIFGENSRIFRENGVIERKTQSSFLGKPCSVVSNEST